MGGVLVIGTGTHQLKGIEIYRGCPIFYSLGNYRSVVPVIETDGRRISSVELVPIELGFDDPSKEKGMPYLADNETSEEIYSRLSALSREYGTHLDFDGRRIHIQL